ncbi:MAG: protein kinase [Planctomycetes bacterium]|nr:protein kinase [Planctomycetota bacterium]
MPDHENTRFGKIAIERGWIAETEMQQVLMDQASDFRRRDRHVGEILVERGLLTSVQVLQILEMQQKAIFTCAGCNIRVNVARVKEKAIYRCKRCGGEMIRSNSDDISATEQFQSHELETGAPVDPGVFEMATVPLTSVEKEARASGRLGSAPASGKIAPLRPEEQSRRNAIEADLTRIIPPQEALNASPSAAVSAPKNEQEATPDVDMKPATSPASPAPSEVKRSTSSAVLPRTDAEMIGVTVGGCLIEAKIGQGGMGTVYRATHLGLDKSVALKFLPKNYAQSAERVERFRREARSAAALDHPNIVQIMNVGSEDDLHYIIMQFIDGYSVDKMIKKGHRFSVEEALRIIIDTAKGLSVAHARGIIHRDVKPDNIMLDRAGMVKILDFGLAKEIDTDISVSRQGKAIGTPYYMSPEQCQGKALDERSDIYSLGVSLYHILTGKRPFVGNSPVETAIKHIKETAIPPSEINGEIPEIVSVYCLTMIAKRKEDRPQSCKEVAAALEEIKRKLTQTELAARTSEINPGSITPSTDDHVDTKDEAGPMRAKLAPRRALVEGDDDYQTEDDFGPHAGVFASQRSSKLPVIAAIVCGVVALIVIVAGTIASGFFDTEPEVRQPGFKPPPHVGSGNDPNPPDGGAIDVGPVDPPVIVPPPPMPGPDRGTESLFRAWEDEFETRMAAIRQDQSKLTTNLVSLSRLLEKVRPGAPVLEKIEAEIERIAAAMSSAQDSRIRELRTEEEKLLAEKSYGDALLLYRASNFDHELRPVDQYVRQEWDSLDEKLIRELTRVYEAIVRQIEIDSLGANAFWDRREFLNARDEYKMLSRKFDEIDSASIALRASGNSVSNSTIAALGSDISKIKNTMVSRIAEVEQNIESHRPKEYFSDQAEARTIHEESRVLSSLIDEVREKLYSRENLAPEQGETSDLIEQSALIVREALSEFETAEVTFAANSVIADLESLKSGFTFLREVLRRKGSFQFPLSYYEGERLRNEMVKVVRTLDFRFEADVLGLGGARWVRTEIEYAALASPAIADLIMVHEKSEIERQRALYALLTFLGRWDDARERFSAENAAEKDKVRFTHFVARLSGRGNDREFLKAVQAGVTDYALQRHEVARQGSRVSEVPRDLRAAVEAFPAFSHLQLFYGELLMRLGQKVEARRHLTIANSLEPNFMTSYRLGACTFANGDEGKAREQLVEAIRLGAPDDERFWLLYGDVLTAAGRTGEAEGSYRKCLDINPYFELANERLRRSRQ